ncbi:hypothetical protein M4R22_21805 [Acidovorax sp. GBBC 3334]|uniref:hypothetical protein n=1 Tax=unclassified Acidovorax TaxID=2684926 RepID=UPI002303902A|nr:MULTISPECIES: hypothetical protein [unclassified Acidovorax]MDA8457404.1 hypothetical protein [Acidovorax sp. GBBC 3334]MDA8521074.1 hypothetical protein [Acidovorax sp. NCPPB 4044]
MYLVVIGWLYVTVMMAVAEASSPQGSLLGALITFTLYGLLPLAIVVYILGTPGRKRALHARERQEAADRAAAQRKESDLRAPPDPDAGGHPPAADPGQAHRGAVREEP